MRNFIVVAVIVLVFIFRLTLLPKVKLSAGQTVRVTGRLTEEPQILGNQQKFKIGGFEVTTQRWPEYHYGEEIEVTGKLKVQSEKCKVTVISSKLKNPFCNGKYLLSYPEIRSFAFICVPIRVNSRVIDIKKLAIWVRLRMKEVFSKSFIAPFDGIMAGVVLGDRSLISFDWWNKFKTTGTLHIMVASGSNIALFSGGLLSLFCTIFVRKISLLILISLIWFYALMTGMQPPIIRAAIMASFVYGSQFFGREKEEKRVLWLTGFLMLLLNPLLISDIGFQLSFLATAGLVYIQPIFKRRGLLKIKFEARNPKHETKDTNFQNSKPKTFEKLEFRFFEFVSNFDIRISDLLKSDNFSSSIAAFLATTPILLLNFGQFNLFSPLINLAILWTIPFLLQAGMGLGILGIFGSLGEKAVEILSFLLYPLLFYLEKIVDWSARWTFLQMEGVKIGWEWVVGYYLILWIWVRNSNEQQEKQ